MELGRSSSEQIFFLSFPPFNESNIGLLYSLVLDTEIYDDEDTTPCFECKTDFIEATYYYHTSCYAYCNQCNICFNRDYEMIHHKSCETFRDFF